MSKDITSETISSAQTEVEEANNKNYLEEFELINDSFPNEDPQ